MQPQLDQMFQAGMQQNLMESVFELVNGRCREPLARYFGARSGEQKSNIFVGVDLDAAARGEGGQELGRATTHTEEALLAVVKSMNTVTEHPQWGRTFTASPTEDAFIWRMQLKNLGGALGDSLQDYAGTYGSVLLLFT